MGTKEAKPLSAEKENASKIESQRATNFIRAIIDEDLRLGKTGGRVITRFPPEPNGYLHIGHAKAICLNFGLARDYQGRCHLRFDDTNPTTEDIEYAEAIQRDIRWLGFDWGSSLFYASDYFDQFYQIAENLVQRGLAYVDSLNEDAIRKFRGTVIQPGQPSPFRDRSVAENLVLLRRMKAGEFAEGAHVLRGKIDLASPNMKMRDPLLYRIRHAHHYRTGNQWCIYPFYDFAHPLSDAIEGITHSICTLEFENNRELYDWVIQHADLQAEPHQYEFARLNLNYTVMSKRKLLQLVAENHVNGWDDPRMLTVAGMRRRGYTPAALMDFCDRIGVTKANSIVDMAQLEFSIRNDLNAKVPRVMAVLDRLKVIIDNFPEGRIDTLNGPLYPHDVALEGERLIPLTRELYIERSDFMQNPPKGFYRLTLGGEVRLRHGYVIRCDKVVKHAQTGAIEVLHCSYDPETLGQNPADRKVKGTIHWVSANRSLPCEIRLYDRLFLDEKPGSDGGDFKANLNPESLSIIHGLVEPSIQNDPAGSRYQFERVGYFCSDLVDSKPDALVFNRTVALRDSWSRQAKKVEAVKVSKPKEAPKSKANQAKLRSWSASEEARLQRYVSELGIAREMAASLVGDTAVADYFDLALEAGTSPSLLANWIVNEWMVVLKTWGEKRLPFQPKQVADLVTLVEANQVSAATAKKVFDLMVVHGGEPTDIVAAHGWEKMRDSASLHKIIDDVIAAQADAVSRYRTGNKKLLGFFVGQVMKATKGQADAKLVNQILREALRGS